MTLFRSTMLCGIHNITQNIHGYFPHHFKYEKYLRMCYEILSVPHNIVMNLDNVMKNKFKNLQRTQNYSLDFLWSYALQI